jgi:hypothetical protein
MAVAYALLLHALMGFNPLDPGDAVLRDLCSRVAALVTRADPHPIRVDWDSGEGATPRLLEGVLVRDGSFFLGGGPGQCNAARAAGVSPACGRDCNARNVSMASSRIRPFSNTGPKCCDSLMDPAVVPIMISHITWAGLAAGLAHPDGCRISAGRTANCPGLLTRTLIRAEMIALAG